MTCGGAFQAKRYIGSYFIEDLFGDRTLTRLLLGAPKTKTNKWWHQRFREWELFADDFAKRYIGSYFVEDLCGNCWM
jgi:hypothetical protein